ncbi:MAG: amidohydrolase [Tissierellia bacterium]|nr:amidohydrolase [Tissierellia bacterium]
MKILIKNVDILAVDEKDRGVFNSNIYIVDDKIEYIGDEIENLEVHRVIDGKNKLAMPGLINSHTHIGMSLLRNYADDLSLHVWLTEKIWPTEDKMNAEDIYWGSLLSIVEMIKSGTTAFCDMYMFMDEVAKGIEESGIRGVLTRGMTEGEDSEAKLNETRELYNNWQGKADGRIKVMIAPHAIYTTSKDFLLKCIDLARELNTGLHIHISETKKEIEDSLQAYGKSPVKYLEEIGFFNIHTIGAHCVHLDDEDIEILAKYNVYPVNNPTSNLKLASGFAPIDKMLKKGITVALGTDGPSSNNNLDMFEEINLASIINKGINLDPLSVSALEAIKMATINGAKALDWGEEIGSLEVGKKADIILLDIDKPHFYPRHNLISAISYTAHGSDVDTVIVDGKIIMEKRELKTLDEELIKFMAEKRAKDLIRR